MSDHAIILKTNLERMSPDLREAFLHVLEWMIARQSTLTAAEISKLVYSELAEIALERSLDAGRTTNDST